VFVGVVLLFILVFGAFKAEFKLWSSREVFFEKGAEGVNIQNYLTCCYSYIII
jgi:hypothetical protein